MIDTIIGGMIALFSVVVGGIVIPKINTRLKNKRIVYQAILNLHSVLHLIKNNLSSYLHQEIFMEQVCDSDEEDSKRLNYLSEQINLNLNSLYSTQQELIKFFKREPKSIAEIYDILNKIDWFIWNTKQYYNNNKGFYDQASSDLYNEELSKIVEGELTMIINQLIVLNSISLKNK